MPTPAFGQKIHNLPLSPVGLGCASAWGQTWFDEKKAARVVERALELGVKVFDTGSSYSGGNAEPRLGRILKSKDTDRLLVSTKIGTRIAAGGFLQKDWEPTALLSSIDASRARLGLDTIPLVYLHGPKVEQFSARVLDTLAEARHRGWVRWFGVNSFDDDVLETLVDVAFFDVVMLDYNILRLDRESVIARLAASGKLVFAGAALANHMHAPQFLRPTNKVDAWYLMRALKNHRHSYLAARKLAFLRHVDNWTPSQLAIGFVLSNKNVQTAMLGTTRVEHLEENLDACKRSFPEAVAHRIRKAQGLAFS